MQYIDSMSLEAFIELEQYTLNDEPYENEIEDYILIINNNDDESIESLNHKLRKHLALVMLNYKSITYNLLSIKQK